MKLNCRLLTDTQNTIYCSNDTSQETPPSHVPDRPGKFNQGPPYHGYSDRVGLIFKGRMNYICEMWTTYMYLPAKHAGSKDWKCRDINAPHTGTTQHPQIQTFPERGSVGGWVGGTSAPRHTSKGHGLTLLFKTGTNALKSSNVPTIHLLSGI